MAHGAYLKILYKAWNDSPHVLTIYKEDFTGSESERTGVDAPTIIDFGDGSAEEIGVIQGSRLKCGFYTEDGDDYSEFSNANKRQYYAVLTTGLYGSNRDIWRGWIVPEQRNEPLTPNQPIYLTFIDGLGELKNIKFSDNGTAYTGRKSWLEILTIVLNKLETNLPIVEDILFKGSGLTGNTLQLNYTDVEIFEGETCSKVITNILAGCTIRQAFTSVQDVFWLIRSNDKIQYIAATEAPATSTTLSYALPKYLYDGTPSGTVTVDYYIKVDDTDLEHESTPHFSDWPAWSELNFTQKLIRNDNLLDDSGGETPSNWTWVNATEKYYNLPNGRNALRMPGVGYYQLGLDANEPDLSTCKYAHQTSTEVIENSAARLKLTFNWNLHALGDTITNVHQGFAWYTVHLFDPDTTDKYAAVLTNDAETGEKYLAFDPLVSLHAIPLSYEYDDDDGTFTPQMIEASKGSEASKLNQFEIIIRGIPFTGVLIVTLYFYQRGIVLEISHSGPVNIASESLTMLWDNIQFQLVDEENKQFEEERGYTLVNPNQYVNNGPDIELLHGTLPDEDNRGSIWISGITTSDSGLVLIDEYESTAFAGTYKYAEMIARIKMGLHLTPALTVQTNMFFHDTVIPYPFVLIYDPNSITSKWLQFNSYSLDYYNGELQNVLMVAVNEFDASSTLIEQTVERSESSGGNSGAPTYGHNPLTLTETSPDVLDGENQILDLELLHNPVTVDTDSAQYASITTDQVLSINPVSLISGVIWYLHEEDSDVTGFETIYIFPAEDAEDSETININSTSGKTLLEQWITAIDYLGLTQIPAGSWNFKLYLSTTALTGTTTITIEVYKRSAADVETLLFSTDFELTATATTEYNKPYYQTADINFDATDRIEVKVYATTDNAAPRDISIYYEGTNHAGHIVTPLAANILQYWHETSYLQEYTLSTQYATIETRSVYADGGLRLTHESDAVNDWKILSQVNVATIENISFKYSDSEMFSFSNTGTFNAVSGYQLNSTDLILDFLEDTTVNSNITKIPQITATGVISWVDLPSVGSGLNTNYIPYWNGSALANSYFYRSSTLVGSAKQLLLTENSTQQLKIYGYADGIASTLRAEMQFGDGTAGAYTRFTYIYPQFTFDNPKGGFTFNVSAGDDVLEITPQGNINMPNIVTIGQLATLSSKLKIIDQTQEQLQIYGYANGAISDINGEIYLGNGSAGQAKGYISYQYPYFNFRNYTTATAGGFKFFTNTASSDREVFVIPTSGSAYFNYTLQVAGNVGVGGAPDASIALKVSGDIYATDNIESELYRLSGYDLSLNALRSDQLGTAGQVLSMSGGVPVWADAAGGGLWTESGVNGIEYDVISKHVGIGATASSTDFLKIVSVDGVKGLYITATTANGIYVSATNYTAIDATAAGANNVALKGYSGSYYAVLGQSVTSNGGYFTSTSGKGVSGISSSGDGGYFTSSTGHGVEGVSTSANGVYGHSTNGAGVYGLSTNGYGGYFVGYDGLYISCNVSGSYVIRGQVGGSTDIFSIDTSGNADFNSLLIGSTTAIDSSGYFKPVTSTDASAPNNSIYYSSDQSKLVYKDSGGTVNNLY